MNIDNMLLIFLLGALLGVMLFFAFAVAPTVFKALPADQAAPYLRAIFPRYYVWAMLIAIVIAALSFNINFTVFIISASAALFFIFSRQFLVPAINRAREAKLAGNAEGQKQFKKLHLISVLINLLEMALLMLSAILLMSNV